MVGSSGGSTVVITSGTSSYGHLAFATGTATNDDEYRGLIQYYHDDNSMRLYTNATEKLRIDTSGNVGIGTTSPDAAAILDVQSTTKGIRFPNMTTTQKNAMANVAGMQVFDTTLSKMCFNTGSAWETITSA